MRAEEVRKKVGGSYQKAVKVYKLIAMVYDKPLTAPKRAWNRAIQLVNDAERG